MLEFSRFAAAVKSDAEQMPGPCCQQLDDSWHQLISSVMLKTVQQGKMFFSLVLRSTSKQKGLQQHAVKLHHRSHALHVCQSVGCLDFEGWLLAAYVQHSDVAYNQHERSLHVECRSLTMRAGIAPNTTVPKPL